jgi:hypothetical protein
MSKPVFVGTVLYRNKRLDILEHVVVGVFSSRTGAEEAIENLTEGTLAVSFDAEVLKTSVTEFEIDRSIETYPEIPSDGVPL